jgi:hypothetical protein
MDRVPTIINQYHASTNHKAVMQAVEGVFADYAASNAHIEAPKQPILSSSFLKHFKFKKSVHAGTTKYVKSSGDHAIV